MKRGEKICVGSMIVCIIASIIGASFGFASAIGMNTQYRFIGELFVWIFLLSLIPICGFICSKILDDPDAREREARRQIGLESPRVLTPEIVEQYDEEDKFE